MKIRVSIPIQVINVPDFWIQANKSEHRLLALDYDGTLAPFHVDTMQAYPLRGIPALLKALSISRNTTVAIVSGRPVQEVCALLGDVGVTLIGCHGFETMDQDGNLTVRGLNAEQLEALVNATRVAVRLGFENRLEAKTASVALHTRGMPPGEASRIEEMMLHEWLRIAPHDLGCRRFNGGVETYCFGWNKGDAVNYILKDLPQGTLPVYIGDDATDEDVFRVLRESGIGIKVGSTETATLAKGFLPDCRAVKAFLCSWLSLIAGKELSL